MQMKMTIDEIKQLLPDPKETVARLDDYIIGQEKAKKVLALSYLHWAILRNKENGYIVSDVNIEKTNVLMMGPTGVGKTALIKALADIAMVPLSIFDATGITASGYVGGSVEDIVCNHCITSYNFVQENADRLIENPDTLPMNVRNSTDLHRDIAETGIIYIDEIDKIKRNLGHGPDVNGDQVQNELLKIIEGASVSFKDSKLPWPNSGLKSLDTSKILFICGGAFSGLGDIIKARMSKGSSIGFFADLSKSKESLNKEADILEYVTQQDLVQFGLKPELLGRLPLISVLKALTPDTMSRIITEPHNSIFSQYEAMFKVFGIKLCIEKPALKLIAEKALELKTGARSLKSMFSQLLMDEFYNIFTYKKKRFVISPQFIEDKMRSYEL